MENAIIRAPLFKARLEEGYQFPGNGNVQMRLSLMWKDFGDGKECVGCRTGNEVVYSETS